MSMWVVLGPILLKHTDLSGRHRGAPFQTPLDKFGGIFISTYYNYPLPK